MRDPKHNFGLIIEAPRITDYVFLGATPIKGNVIFPDGHGWGQYLPEGEMQFSDHTDFMDCVTESYTNIVEILSKALYNVDSNKSERYTAKMSGTTKMGNSQWAVAESGRKDGLVPEEKWPRNRHMTWDQYYAPIFEAVKAIGRKYAKEWTINYEWVETNHRSLKEALKYGPVWITGYAWGTNSKNLYDDFGYRPNHAFVLYDYTEGQSWHCYDSYPTDFVLDDNSTKQEFIKMLDWNFNFGNAMKLTVKKAQANPNLLSILKRMWDNFRFYLDSKGIYHFFTKKDSSGVMRKQLIDPSKPEEAIKGILTILRENGLAKPSSWGELSKYPDRKFW